MYNQNRFGCLFLTKNPALLSHHSNRLQQSDDSYILRPVFMHLRGKVR